MNNDEYLCASAVRARYIGHTWAGAFLPMHSVSIIIIADDSLSLDVYPVERSAEKRALNLGTSRFALLLITINFINQLILRSNFNPTT